MTERAHRPRRPPRTADRISAARGAGPVGPPRDAVPTVASKAAMLRRLELQVTHRLDGLVTGDFLGLLPGPGSEVAGARAYEPGDDARRIDWSLTARSLAPHVRTTEADRELEAWVVADCSASLDFGTTKREKRELVLAATAAFGSLIVRGGNRLGVVVSGGERIARLEPGSSRQRLLATLSRLYDAPRREAPPGQRADLAAALDHLARLQRRRGVVVVASDFLDSSDWGSGMRRLSLRHAVIAVQVIDPRELELPAVGILSLVDPESGRQLHVQTNSAKLRDDYARAARARHEAIAAAIRNAGARHLVLSTDGDWLLDIVRFVSGARSMRPVPGALAGAQAVDTGAIHAIKGAAS